MNTPIEPTNSASREAHLRDYWKVVWQGRWTALAIFVVVLGATAIWTFLQTPIYRATATVEVQIRPTTLLGGRDVSGMGATGYGWWTEENYRNTQVEILKSRDVSERVVQLLDLASHPQFEMASDPIEAFQGLIRVESRRDTALLEVSIAGRNADECAQWANAVTQAYVERNFDRAKANVTRAVTSIRDQMDNLREDLQEAEGERISALEDTRIYDVEAQEQVLRQNLEAYNADLTEKRMEYSQLANTLREIRTMQSKGEDLMSLPEFAGNEPLQQLVRDRTDVLRKRSSARVELKPSHPKYKQFEAELEQLDGKIQNKIALIVGLLERKYTQLQDYQKFLTQKIGEAERDSWEINRARSGYDIIKTGAEAKGALFGSITKAMQEVSLNAELMSNNVNVLDQARSPRFPIKPRKRVNLMIGAVFGMFLGLGAVFFLDYLDNTIRTPEDIERFLGLSVLCVVPKVPELSLSQRGIREAFQSLRTSIIFSSKNRQNRVILITSTGPREGKSSTVANLARTLATAGDRVVILDCDLRRPKQQEQFDCEREPGLTNYLAAPTDETDWSKYSRHMAERLDLFTCGPLPPNPPELLGNERFGDLLRSLRESYDWVLIDSPPAANLADASLLASAAEMVVFVVRHNATDRDHLIKSFQQIRAVNPAVAGVVLNSVDLERTYHKDYYYAAYYYEEDEAKDKDKTSRKRRTQRAQAG